jgi:hypothetical protein
MIKARFHDGIRLPSSCHNDRADGVVCTSSNVSLRTSPLPLRPSQNAPRPRSWRGPTPWVARHGGVLCNVDTTSWPAGCVSHAESSQGIAQDDLAGPAMPRQALLGTTPSATSRSSLRTRPFGHLRTPSASFPVPLHHMRRTPPCLRYERQYKARVGWCATGRRLNTPPFANSSRNAYAGGVASLLTTLLCTSVLQAQVPTGMIDVFLLPHPC